MDLTLLKQNSGEKLLEGVQILIKLLENIVREPDNPKFRTINLENKIIKNKLFSLDRIVQFLETIGFVQVSDKKYLFNLMMIKF